MAAKNLGQKIKIAFLIYLSNGESPGKADFLTQLKMAIYLTVFVGIIAFSVFVGIKMGPLKGIFAFLLFWAIWTGFVFFVRNPAAFCAMGNKD